MSVWNKEKSNFWGPETEFEKKLFWYISSWDRTKVFQIWYKTLTVQVYEIQVSHNHVDMIHFTETACTWNWKQKYIFVTNLDIYEHFGYFSQ